MFSHWLSWYVLPSDPKDGLNSYVFYLAIRLAKAERLVIVLIYDLSSPFYRLGECIGNIGKVYTALSCGDSRRYCIHTTTLMRGLRLLIQSQHSMSLLVWLKLKKMDK